MQERFEVGQVVTTRGVATACENDLSFTEEVQRAYLKYIACDWGETSEADRALNDSAVENHDDRILAKYITSKGNIFIITEWDRSATTILFANEY